MRTILGLVLLALAGFLIWDGIDSFERAKAELEKSRAGATHDVEPVQRLYPYSNPAIVARELTLDKEIQAREATASGKTVDKEDLKKVGMGLWDRVKTGISGERPYVQPDAAAIIGVAGLLLALILPGTRFRGLALLGLLIGGAAALVGMLPADNQVALVQKFNPLKYIITSFPRVAQACVALAGITLIARVRLMARTPATR